MTLREKQSLFVRLTAKLIDFATQQGYELTYGDAWARTGHRKGSLHYDRLAVDFNLFRDGIWLTATEAHRELGEYWESLHPLARWGGRFSDGNHYSVEHQGRK